MPVDEISIPGFENMEGVELVQQLPLFRTLTFEETRRLFAIARAERRAAGEVLIDEGALGEALFIMRSGTAKVTRQGNTIGSCGPGELLGEMSLVDDVLTSCRVEAEAECEVLILPRTDFDKLMAEDLTLATKVYKAFCRTLADRLRRSNELLPTDKALTQGVF